MGEAEGAPLLTTREVASKCGSGTTQSTIQFAARTGLIRGQKVGGTWRFSEQEAANFCLDFQEQKLERNRTRKPVNRLMVRFRKMTGQAIALLHLSATIITLVPAILYDDFAIAGYALALWNLTVGASSFVWSKLRPTSAEPVDPDIFGWHRNEVDRRTEQVAQDSVPQLGGMPEPGAVLIESQARDGITVWQSVQIVSLIGAAAYGVVSTPLAVNQLIADSDNGPSQGSVSKPFSSCREWLSGAGVQVGVEFLDFGDVLGGQGVLCSGSVEGSSGEIILVFPREDSPDDWADIVFELEPIEGCVSVTLPDSGLPGCLHDNGDILDLVVRVRDDLVVEMIWGSDVGGGPDLRATVEHIVNHIANVSEAAPDQ